jgi:hypothetical protein
MKTVITLLVAGITLIAVEAISAKPAEAFGWCGWGGRSACGYRSYRPVVRYYRPVVRSYRPVRYYAPARRGCWW